MFQSSPHRLHATLHCLDSSPSIIASSSHQVQSIKPLDLVVKPPVFASPGPGPPDCSKTHWQTQEGLGQVPQEAPGTRHTGGTGHTGHSQHNSSPPGPALLEPAEVAGWQSVWQVGRLAAVCQHYVEDHLYTPVEEKGKFCQRISINHTLSIW